MKKRSLRVIYATVIFLFFGVLLVQGGIVFWKLARLERFADIDPQSDQYGSLPDLLRTELFQMRLLWALTLLAIAIFVAWIAWYFLFRSFRKFKEVASEVHLMEKGRLDVRVEPTGIHEVDELADSFNAAIQSLRETTVRKDELERIVSDRVEDLTRFFDLIPDLLCVVSEEGKFHRVNRAFGGMLGYSEDEVLGLLFGEIVHPDDIGAALDVFEELKQGGKPLHQFENRIRHRNGEWRDLSWNAIFFERTQEVFATAREITAQKIAREREAERIRFELKTQRALMDLRESINCKKAEFFAKVTEVCAECLSVERASVWQFHEDGSRVRRQDLFDADLGKHISGVEILEENFPSYFREVVSAAKIVVEDVYTDSMTRDFAEEEYRPLEIYSLLDIPIRAGGRLYGLLSCEQKYRRREWGSRDVEFLNGVAGAILLFLEFRKRTETNARLLRSESYNRSIVENSRDAIILLSPDGCVEDIPYSTRRLFGGAVSKEMLGKDWTELWSLPFRAKAKSAVRSAMNGETVRFRGEGVLLESAGAGWWDVVISPIRDEGGESGAEVLRILTVSRDVTEEKIAEEKMREFNQSLEDEVLRRTAEFAASEERFRLMIEQVEDYAIFMLNPQGNVMTWNAGAERAKGYKADEILGKNYSCFYEASDREARVPENILKTAREEGKIRVEGWRLRKDGSRFWADVVITAIHGPDQSLLGFAKVTRDRTELRAAELAVKKSLERQKELTRQAQAGERAKSDFLAVMSHELRTPMNGVLGFAELLLDSEDLSEEDRDFVTTLYDSSRALLKILDDILDFISSEAGTMRVEAAPFQPRRLLEDVRLILSSLAAEKGLSLIVNVDEEVPRELDADEGRLRQILLNLIGNAVKFTEEGKVEVRMRRCKDIGSRPGWRVEVSDTGLGIPEEKREVVFEPFTQVDSSSSRRFDGSGLGLSISRRLAELMGGTLELDSSAAEGSLFVLSLPMGAKDEPSKGAGGTSAESTEEAHLLYEEFPLRVMIVEDNAVNRKMLTTLLTKLGYEPIVAVDGRDAVERYRNERPECIFMDLQMPEMNGVEATEEIRKMESELGGTPAFISALTANTVIADRKRCIEVGMSFYLNKPVRKNTIIAALMQAHDFCGKSTPEVLG